MGKIKIDASGNVSGAESIKKNEKVEFDADLRGKKSCTVKIVFVDWDPPSGGTPTASAGTIKIGS